MATRLVKLSLQYLHRLCEERGIRLDDKYWKEQLEEILSIQNCKEVIVVPARAGSGKSTVILAFLLALTDLFLKKDTFANSLVGAMIVVQKVETLNTITDTLDQYFPDRADEVFTAMQGWSPSGQSHGYCSNKEISSFQECQSDNCPFSSSCKVLEFNRRAVDSYLLGMTQARFSLLRSNGGLDRLLSYEVGDHKVARRFLIFDEKFEMADISVLRCETINDASNEFEKRGKQYKIPDKVIRRLQANLLFQVRKPFQELRSNTVFESGKDQAFGFCRLTDSPKEALSTFEDFRDSFDTGYRKRFLNKPLEEALNVINALYHQRCLFSKTGGFQIMYARQAQAQFGHTQTIIFDATAEVDGDYQYLPNRHFLPSPPAKHMEQVSFHIYQHPDLNVSKTAMKGKGWKLPAFAELISDILREYPNRTFLCTYQEYSRELLALFPSEQAKLLARMTNDPSCLPYFGGTNGANDFNDCYNVILLGYPRLDPTTYLFHAYAMQQENGLTEELLQLFDEMELMEAIPYDVLRQVPMLREYENRHLAARLEQEIYRCALRNPECPQDIHVFLFDPAKPLQDILLNRFSGCTLTTIPDLPKCVEKHKNRSRCYANKPTALNKIANFLENDWNHQPVTPCEIQTNLDISQSAWKELRKNARFRDLLEQHQIVEVGRGANARFQQRG